MDHDYAHCGDFTEECPKECFRAQLVRDLKNMPYGYCVTWMDLKGTEPECPYKKEEKEEK